MNHAKSILVAGDIRSAVDPIGRMWLAGLVASFIRHGWRVHVLTREVNAAGRDDALIRLGAELITDADVPAEQLDAHGQTARFRSRAVIAHAEELRVGAVLVQGRDLCRFVAASGRLDHRLWTVPLDRPFAGGPISRDDFGDLDTIAAASTRIFVADEVQRSTLDAEFPAATSKVRVLPLVGRAVPARDDETPGRPARVGAGAIADGGAIADLHLHAELLTDADIPSLGEFAARLRASRTIPRLLVHTAAGSDATTDSPVHAALRSLPGAVDGGLFPSTGDRATTGGSHVDADDRATTDGWELLPADPRGRHYGRLIAASTGRPCAVLDSTGRLIPDSPDNQADEADESATDAAGPSAHPDPLAEVSAPPVDTGLDRPLRTVIAGSDFKFAGDLIESFLADPGFDVRFDVFDHHSRTQPAASAPYLDWAEVIIAEFAVRNAVWYSHNVAPHQSLIVHLHGFELLSDVIEELDVDRVTAIVVASEFYRQKAHDLRGWPLEKIQVVPNSVNPFDLVRPKLDDARFHLGLVGMVPILKRPDRALDLLESLVTVDPRYVLHIRGHAPWNYAWEWKKAAHQDAYRELFRRIGERPALREHISIEPFAPDMANWLRKIGWVLSPSSRETFHLAAIEAAMSGAVPLAREREGAREIIGEEFTFTTTEAVASFVLAHNSSASDHRSLAEAARRHAERYRSDVVGSLWRTTAADLHRGASSPATDAGLVGEAASVFHEADVLVRAGEFDEAKGYLDRSISVTKSDDGVLKVLEMFVRGLLALDARRTNLLPATTSTGTGPFADSGWVRATALTPAPVTGTASSTTLLIDPRLVTCAVGIAPFGYTGDECPPAAEATAAGSGNRSGTLTGTSVRAGTTARSATSARAVVTDPLEEHLDIAIRVDDRIRFDRWVEVVAAELAEHVPDGTGLLIDAPWHIALPAALAAARRGIPYVWAPTAEEWRTTLPTIADRPYTGDLIAQFAGLVATRALAVVAADPDLACSRIPRRIVAAPVPHHDTAATGRTALRSPARGDEHVGLIDAATLRRIDDLAEAATRTGSHRALGALHGTASSSRGRLRIAALGSPGFLDRLARHGSVIDVVRIRSADELTPAFDALIVDGSVLDHPTAVPGHTVPGRTVPGSMVPGRAEFGAGDAAARVRALFDRARSLGVLGIMNATSHVGGERPATRMAEKADAVTGTRAARTMGLLRRNPTSITRVGSASLDTDDADALLAAFAAIGVGTHADTGAAPGSADPAPATAASVPADLSNAPTARESGGSTDASALQGLALPASDGVSVIVATRLGAERLPTMLASIAAQTLDPSLLELIVVRNGPDDGSAEVLAAWGAAHPDVTTLNLRSEVEGASAARNIGLRAASRDYVTFVDDDDEIDANFLLNLWLSAAPDVVVAAPMRDVTPEGEVHIDTPTTRRLAALRGRRTDLRRASGLLSLNACKLIPRAIAADMRYQEGLASGEDVAFMSQLLLHDLTILPADTAPQSAYVRHRRPDSVSRRALTRDFAVSERLAVIACLEDVRAAGPAAITGCIRALVHGQLSFVAQYAKENPSEVPSVVAEALAAGITPAQLRARSTVFHPLTHESTPAPV